MYRYLTVALVEPSVKATAGRLQNSSSTDIGRSNNWLLVFGLGQSVQFLFDLAISAGQFRVDHVRIVAWLRRKNKIRKIGHHLIERRFAFVQG